MGGGGWWVVGVEGKNRDKSQRLAGTCQYDSRPLNFKLRTADCQTTWIKKTIEENIETNQEILLSEFN